jgi:hypothetical protein
MPSPDALPLTRRASRPIRAEPGRLAFRCHRIPNLVTSTLKGTQCLAIFLYPATTASPQYCKALTPFCSPSARSPGSAVAEVAYEVLLALRSSCPASISNRKESFGSQPAIHVALSGDDRLSQRVALPLYPSSPSLIEHRRLSAAWINTILQQARTPPSRMKSPFRDTIRS